MTDYFESYHDGAVHRLMLADQQRMQSYYRAISLLPNLPSLTILDIGGGSGILSIMAAKLGAKKVICVEASPMAKEAEKMAAKNGVQHKMVVLNEISENLTTETLEAAGVAGGKVDVVMSEWMGFHLYHENMLPSVLLARDALVKPHGPNGEVLPWQILSSAVSISMAVADLSDEYYETHGLVDEIHRQFGIDFSECAALQNEEEYRTEDGTPQIMNIQTEAIEMCEPRIIHEASLNSLPADFFKEGIRWEGPIELRPRPRACPLSPENGFTDRSVHGIVIWFDCYFKGPASACGSIPTTAHLSTRPGTRTHWKQSVIWLDRLDAVAADITVKVELTPSEENERHVEIGLEIQAMQRL